MATKKKQKENQFPEQIYVAMSVTGHPYLTADASLIGIAHRADHELDKMAKYALISEIELDVAEIEIEKS